MKSPTHSTAACGPATLRSACPVHFTRRVGLWSVFSAALVLFPLVPEARGADFSVTAPGFFYSFNGTTGQNPTLTVVRGETYTFAVNTTTFHPFRINSTGALNNPTSSGTITWTVPLAASNYTYQCAIHGFGGSILTVPPPTVRIVDLAVGSNLTFKSTGASNYSVMPEFKTNVIGANWFALTVQTNRFLLGTNETICGLPPGSNVFIRVKAQRN